MQLRRTFLAGLAILLAFAAMPASPEHLNPPQSTIPKVYFGMHIHGMVVPRRHAEGPDKWPNVPFGSWRLWDAYVTWPELEPERGKWNFSTLDKYVSMAEAHHVQILLTLGLTPPWASSRPNEKSVYGPGRAAPPRNMADWKTYIQTVATRYKGRITGYEIWNEPNSRGMFTGDMATLADMSRDAYQTLKHVDPTITVVSPCFNASDDKTIDLFNQFLAKGGGKYADVIGYHFYPPAPKVPEQIPQLVSQVRGVMKSQGIADKPIWDTETGWDIENKIGPETKSPRALRILSSAEGAGFVARAYVLAWASGVSRLYWYSWDNQSMGLIEPDIKTVKLAAVAYGQVENWLVGARMTSCASGDHGVWTCTLVRDNGYKGWIEWDPKGNQEVEVPKAWGVHQARDLASNVRQLGKANRVRVGRRPLLLENKPE